MEHPIDIVIPWVNGSDPEWLKEKEKYIAANSSDNSSSRYREWDVFRYWFRAVEQNMPWIRKVHFLTWGHTPKWLNINHPKLNIVNHKEFIPNKYLPIYSSHVIELNLHRIPDLSDHFIYFNDDVYPIKKMKREDFFINGLPCDSAILGAVKNDGQKNFMPYIMLNCLGVINEYFNQRNVIKAKVGNWFTPKYGKYNLNNLYLLPWNNFLGFRNFHTAHSYLKSTFEEVWHEIPEALGNTCRHRFRDKMDFNQYLFRYWQLCKNQFVPKKPDSSYVNVGKVSRNDLENILLGKEYKIACINDDPGDFDLDKKNQELEEILNKLFPEKSKFEI